MSGPCTEASPYISVCRGRAVRCDPCDQIATEGNIPSLLQPKGKLLKKSYMYICVKILRSNVKSVTLFPPAAISIASNHSFVTPR